MDGKWVAKSTQIPKVWKRGGKIGRRTAGDSVEGRSSHFKVESMNVGFMKVPTQPGNS